MNRTARLAGVLTIAAAMVLGMPLTGSAGDVDVFRDRAGDGGTPEFDLREVRFGRFPKDVMRGRLWILYTFEAPWKKNTLRSNFSDFVGVDINGREPVQVGSSVHDGEEQHLYFLVRRSVQLDIDYKIVDGSLLQILPNRARRDLRNGELFTVFSAVRPTEQDEQMNDFIEAQGARIGWSTVDDLGFGPPEMEQPDEEGVPIDAEDEPTLGGDGLVIEDDGIPGWLCWGGGFGAGFAGIGTAYGVGRSWRDRPRRERYRNRAIVGGIPTLGLFGGGALFGEPAFGLILALGFGSGYGGAWGLTRVWEPAHVIKKGFGWDERDFYADDFYPDDPPPQLVRQAVPKKPTRKKPTAKKTARKKPASKKSTSKKSTSKKSTRKRPS